MHGTLFVRFLLCIVVIASLSSGIAGQTGTSAHHAGDATLADQTFAKEQILNAKDRFEFWFAHLPDLERAKEKNKNEWQIHVDWSIQDHGFVESNIQKVWRDELTPPIYEECIWAPGAEGRKTAMKIAIADAKAGDCKNAGLITVSTQLHNPEAIDTFHTTDPQEFCKYLKAK
jgi:hypothetical protein